MQNSYRDLIRLYTDREYAGKLISLDNVSNSCIRSLVVCGETVEVGQGDKSPNNPYEFIGTESNLNITGANFFSPINGVKNNGANYEVLENGDITVTGYKTKSAVIFRNISALSIAGKRIYLSCDGIENQQVNTKILFGITNSDGETTYKILSSAGTTAFTVPTNTARCALWLMLNDSSSVEYTEPVTCVFKGVMLSFAKLPYQKYNGQTLTVPVLHSVGSVYDTYNPLTGECTMSTELRTLTGENDEVWRMSAKNDDNVVFSLTFGAIGIDYSKSLMCNILSYKGVAGGYADALSKGIGLYKWISNNIVYWYFVVPLTVATNLDDWKMCLQDNSVQVMYVLDSPIIITTTPANITATVPYTNIWLADDNGLGDVNVTLQTKE